MIYLAQFIILLTLSSHSLWAEKDPYSVLGLDQATTFEEGQTRYRQLVKAYHPDLNGGSAEGVEKLSDVMKAWRELKSILPRSEVALRESRSLEKEHEDLLNEIALAKSQPEVWAYMEDRLLSALEELQQRYEKSKLHSICEKFFL